MLAGMTTFTPDALEQSAARFLHDHDPGSLCAALVAGSGITLDAPGWVRGAEIPYAEVFPFEIMKLPGHTPTVTVWRRGEAGLLAFNGRFHLYQGYSPAQVAAIPRLAGLLGARAYVATNAVGSLDTGIPAGDVVLIQDHLNLQAVNPLVGEWGRWRPPIFPDLTDAYDPELRRVALDLARRAGFGAHEGVYCAMLGPSYETPAEIRMLRALGGTVVGMSTVQEVIAARHLGLKVLVISLVTNLAAGIAEQALTHEEVLEVGNAAKGKLGELLRGLLNYLAAKQ